MLRRQNFRTALIVSFLLVVALVYWAHQTYQPRLEYDLIFYDRQWLQKEIETVAPLSDCFNPSKISPKYNLTRAFYGPKHTELHAGLSLRIGMDCYAFAGTIQSPPSSNTSSLIPGDDRVQYHVYWRADLAAFGPRQEWMLKSFFATQNLQTSRLILWSNGKLPDKDNILGGYLRRYPHAFTMKIVDKEALAKGTKLEGSTLLSSDDSKAWLDSDLLRLLVLWHYGGVWVDMDMLLTRDLTPLLEHEYVTQWDCFDQKYRPFNGAHLRFHQHSPYLCEAFDIMVSSDAPRPGTTDWGSLLYLKLWRRLIQGSVPPFKVLPFCFTDSLLCRVDNRLPDPFAPDSEATQWMSDLGLQEGGGLDKILNKIFMFHLHNRWDTNFPSGGWVERLLLNPYEKKINSQRNTH